MVSAPHLLGWAMAAALWPGVAQASWVIPMDEAALNQGADAVVRGQVLSAQAQWNADNTGLETHVQFRVQTVLKGPAPAQLELVLPGGTLNGSRHIVVGMPTFVPGELAQLFLRRLPGLQPRYRVFGWWQGKWSPVFQQGVVTSWVQEDRLPLPPGAAGEFTTNGMVWPAAKIPVPYLVNSVGSDDLTLEQIRQAAAAGFSAWQNVPCSSLAFTYAGETQLQVAVDQQNVILFIESGWVYGEEAAGATALWIPVEGEQTADIAINGEFFSWAVEPPPQVAPATLDLQAVLTHEMGHFSGLSHSQRAFDTMYFSWSPWPGQRTLSVDDKRGLCSLYPVQADECTTEAHCDAAQTCQMHEHGRLCQGTPDPAGTFCNHARVECDSFCLFTAADLSTGYCSRTCDTNADCPSGYQCQPAQGGSLSVKACFTPFPPGPDAGAPPDASITGTDASVASPDAGSECDACPEGTYCDAATRRCTFDCRNHQDCGAGLVCSEQGQCLQGHPNTAGTAEGCTCRGMGGGAGWLWLAAAGVGLRRRMRGSPGGDEAEPAP